MMSNTTPDLPLPPLKLPTAFPRSLKSFRLDIGIVFRINGLVAVVLRRTAICSHVRGLRDKSSASADAMDAESP